MKKKEFLEILRKKLNGLPKDDIDERINFYSEMIDDRVEDGKSEDEAINDIGGIDGVIADIAKDTPLVNLVKEKIKPKRKLSGFEILLLILGFPLWFPLLLVGMILFLVGYFILWILEIALYAVDLSLVIGGVLSIIVFFLNLGDGKLFVSYLGMSLLAFGGFGIIMILCIFTTKGVIKISKKNAIKIKSWFIRGGKNEKIS